MYRKQNNYAFIDTQNLSKSIERQSWKLDYKRFVVYLRDKYKVHKVFIFFGYIPKNEPMYQALRGYGYTIIFKPVLPYGPIKGNVDGELILHTMIECPNFNQAVIVSGDGDFYCLLEYLEARGKLYRLIIPDQYAFSGLLKPFQQKADFINPQKERLEYKKSRV